MEAVKKAQTDKLKTSESKLAESTDFIIDSKEFENILRLISSGYILYNNNTNTYIISGSLKELLSSYLPNDEINLENLLSIIHPDDRMLLDEILTFQRTTKKGISGQFRISPKSKEGKETRFFSINADYSKNKNNEGIILCVVHEITKEVKSIRDLQRSKEKSQESDNIKTIFLSNISHNIRTPMNSILGFAELMSISDPGPERRKEYIRLIKKQSKNLLQLIDDVSEIARYESGSMTITKTPCNPDLLLNEILRDCDNLKTSLQREQVTFELNYPKNDHIEIYTDTGRLHQIFLNLINFSLKNNIQGSIEIGYKLPTENKIDFFIKNYFDEKVKEEQKQIFIQTNQLDLKNVSRYDEEIGLGITIAKGIIKLLGGKIWIESDDKDSLTINFNIPFETLSSETITEIEEEIDIKAKYRWNNKVILIVEDEEVNGLFLEAVFHDTGARTLYAKNGFQAVELCKTINKIDLILMDIRMPVMNGLKATQEIRKFNNNVPIIAQTALNLDEDRDQCILAGCNDAITKPIDIEELMYLLSKYLSA